MSEPIPLVYIFGSSHSGSTLLDLLLGTHSRIESVGEFKRIGRLYEGPAKKQICTCGEPFSLCPFWTRVRSGADPAANFPAWSDLSGGPAFRDGIGIMAGSILAASGKSILCDSSKNRGWLKLLSDSGCFTIHLVHLVRDGRAVAYSNMKRDRPYWHWLRKWSSDNTKTRQWAETLAHVQSYTLIRYEDLTSDPGQAIAPLLGEMGLSWEAGQLGFGSQVHHNLAGNNMRRRTNQTVEFDGSYLDELGPLQWYGGYLAAISGMKKYGYPFRRSGSHVAPVVT